MSTGTEAGWKKKKSERKTKNINWKSTLTNAIDLNKVYKPRDFSSGQNRKLKSQKCTKRYDILTGSRRCFYWWSDLDARISDRAIWNGERRSSILWALNKAIFKILLKLQNTNTPIDLIHVTTELKKNNASQNEIMRLGDIVSSASYSTDLSSLAKIMVEDHVKRQMMSVLDDLKQKLLKNEDDIGSLLFQLQNASNELEKNFDCMDSGLSSKEVAKITVEEIYLDVERAKKGQPAGINTGFSKLNMLSGGFKPNMFFILAARPSVGKTSVALHFLKTAAAQNKWVNMFSFEMDESEMFKILLASESDVNRTNIRDGKLDDTELRKINSAVGFNGKLAYCLDFQANEYKAAL